MFAAQFGIHSEKLKRGRITEDTGDRVDTEEADLQVIFLAEAQVWRTVFRATRVMMGAQRHMPEDETDS